MNASHPSGRVSSSSGSLAKFAAMRRASSRVIRFIAERRRDAAICPESGQEQTSQIGVTKSVFDPIRKWERLECVARGVYHLAS